MARMNWQRVGQQQRLERSDDYSARADREDSRIVEGRPGSRRPTPGDLAASGGPGKRARREAMAYALGITTDQLKAIMAARTAATKSTSVTGVPKAQRAARIAKAMGWSTADLEKLRQAERAVNAKRMPARDPISASAKRTLPKDPAAVAKAEKARKKREDLKSFQESITARTYTSAGKRRPPNKRPASASRRKARPGP